jgi:hypothetical protein
MTLFQMAAAIAAVDAAMVLEGVDQATRERVLDRFGKSLAKIVTTPPRNVVEFPTAVRT